MLFGTWRRRVAGAWHRAAGPHGIDALLDAGLNDQAERLAQAMIDLLVPSRPHRQSSGDENGRLPAVGQHPRACGRQTKFENVNVNVTTVPTPKIPRATYLKMLVKLGPMIDCCRIHRF